jgi:hypothetical protein
MDSGFHARLPGLLASLEKARAGGELEVLVLTLDDGGQDLDALLAHFCAMRALHWPGLKLVFYVLAKGDVDALFAYLPGSKGILGHVSSATMLRLLAPELLSRHGDVLFLDMDVMVRGLRAFGFGSKGTPGLTRLCMRRACSRPLLAAALHRG